MRQTIKINDKVWVPYAGGNHLGRVVELDKDKVRVKFNGIFSDTPREGWFKILEVTI